jgi:AcrR family transcriptional regulator
VPEQHGQQSGRGRPRRAETDERIVAATLGLIREQGPEAVNVASVAARSGVARTTIYRRFRDREELLRAALQPVSQAGAPPDAASVEEKFRWVLGRTQEVLAGSIGMGGVAAIVADNDPDFSAALRAVLRTALDPIGEQIADDVARGRLEPHVDADIVLNLVLGSYLAEVVRYAEPRPDWVDRTAKLLATSLGSPP